MKFKNQSNEPSKNKNISNQMQFHIQQQTNSNILMIKTENELINNNNQFKNKNRYNNQLDYMPRQSVPYINNSYQQKMKELDQILITNNKPKVINLKITSKEILEPFVSMLKNYKKKADFKYDVIDVCKIDDFVIFFSRDVKIFYAINITKTEFSKFFINWPDSLKEKTFHINYEMIYLIIKDSRNDQIDLKINLQNEEDGLIELKGKNTFSSGTRAGNIFFPFYYFFDRRNFMKRFINDQPLARFHDKFLNDPQVRGLINVKCLKLFFNKEILVIRNSTASQDDGLYFFDPKDYLEFINEDKIYASLEKVQRETNYLKMYYDQDIDRNSFNINNWVVEVDLKDFILSDMKIDRGKDFISLDFDWENLSKNFIAKICFFRTKKSEGEISLLFYSQATGVFHIADQVINSIKGNIDFSEKKIKYLMNKSEDLKEYEKKFFEYMDDALTLKQLKVYQENIRNKNKQKPIQEKGKFSHNQNAKRNPVQANFLNNDMIQIIKNKNNITQNMNLKSNNSIDNSICPIQKLKNNVNNRLEIRKKEADDDDDFLKNILPEIENFCSNLKGNVALNTDNPFIASEDKNFNINYKKPVNCLNKNHLDVRPNLGTTIFSHNFVDKNHEQKKPFNNNFVESSPNDNAFTSNNFNNFINFKSNLPFNNKQAALNSNIIPSNLLAEKELFPSDNPFKRINPNNKKEEFSNETLEFQQSQKNKLEGTTESIKNNSNLESSYFQENNLDISTIERSLGSEFINPQSDFNLHLASKLNKLVRKEEAKITNDFNSKTNRNNIQNENNRNKLIINKIIEEKEEENESSEIFYNQKLFGNFDEANQLSKKNFVFENKNKSQQIDFKNKIPNKLIKSRVIQDPIKEEEKEFIVYSKNSHQNNFFNILPKKINNDQKNDPNYLKNNFSKHLDYKKEESSFIDKENEESEESLCIDYNKPDAQIKNLDQNINVLNNKNDSSITLINKKSLQNKTNFSQDSNPKDHKIFQYFNPLKAEVLKENYDSEDKTKIKIENINKKQTNKTSIDEIKVQKPNNQKNTNNKSSFNLDQESSDIFDSMILDKKTKKKQANKKNKNKNDNRSISGKRSNGSRDSSKINKTSNTLQTEEEGLVKKPKKTKKTKKI